jgi:hypothetical protein
MRARELGIEARIQTGAASSDDALAAACSRVEAELGAAEPRK